MSNTLPPINLQVIPATVTYVAPEPISRFVPLGANAAVILRAAGSYREAPLFLLEGYLYAKLGNGFIKLRAHGETSKPKTYWSHIKTMTPIKVVFDGLVLQGDS